MLYEVAVVEKAAEITVVTGAELAKPFSERLILSPTSVCAPTKEVAIALAMAKVDLTDVDNDRLEILVRPFCSS